MEPAQYETAEQPQAGSASQGEKSPPLPIAVFLQYPENMKKNMKIWKNMKKYEISNTKRNT